MNMKKYILIILTVSMMASSCEKFLDVNRLEDYPSESTPNFLLPPVQAWLGTAHFDHGECNAYFAQQVATLSGYHKYKDRWDWVDANRIAQWRRHYHDVGVNALNLIKTSAAEGSKNYEAVGRICFVLSFQLATDVFGDMPYDQAFMGNPSPRYDAQSYIYTKMLAELEIALQNIVDHDPVTNRKMTSKEDIVFNGDIAKWKQLALALRARILLHLTPNVNQDYEAVITAANAALTGWTDVLYDYSKGDGKSALQMNQWGPSKADPDWDYANNILDLSAPSEFMLLHVLKYDYENATVTDPRQPLLMTPRDTTETGEDLYLYVVPTEGKDAIKANTQYPDLYNSYVTKDLSPMIWFAEEELHFILAEAYFLSGNPGPAFTSFVAGIQKNMQRAGVASADIAAFLAGPNVPHNSTELTISDIMMQKYLALYLQGEVWTDMRRHDYDPQIYKGLKKPKYLAYYWDATNPDEWIERLPYDTETEEIYNKPTLVELGAYQNPEWMKKPMFWAK
jgi:hypothetical protein